MTRQHELAKELERQLGGDVLPSMWGIHAEDMRLIISALRVAQPVDAAPQAQWISVAERLPESDASVLVWGGPERMAYFEKGSWWTLDGRYKHIRPGITHWMPLPAPPAQGERS